VLRSGGVSTRSWKCAPQFAISAVLGATLGCVACGRVDYDLLAAGELGSLRDAASDAPGSVRGAGGRGGGVSGAGGISGGPMDGGGDAAPKRPIPCNEVVPTVSDECTELPYLPVPPFIDGLPECGLPLYALDPVGFDPDAGSPDAVTVYSVAWRPDGIYFFVRVTDPTAVPPDPGAPASFGDAVELYVDGDGTFTAAPAYDDPGTRRFVVAAPSGAVAPEARGEVWSGSRKISSWTSTQFRAYPRSFGYIVEAFVRAGDLGLPRLDYASGRAVAWDLGVDVSYPLASTTGAEGHRLGRYVLHGAPPPPETDVTAFCSATLAAP
jgi:hypothetical protein